MSQISFLSFYPYGCIRIFFLGSTKKRKKPPGSGGNVVVTLQKQKGFFSLKMVCYFLINEYNCIWIYLGLDIKTNDAIHTTNRSFKRLCITYTMEVLGGEPVGSLRSTMAWDSEERRLVRVCIVLRVWARAHVQRRSHGLNCQPTPKQTAPSLFYRLLRGWHKGKREWWGLRSASSQTSKDGVRILIIDMLGEEDRTNILGLACIYRKC